MILTISRVFALWLLAFGLAFSQPKDPIFRRMHSDAGLASDATTVSVRDQNGYLWIGTKNGLSKLKSFSEFEEYHSMRRDTNTLSHDYIRSLFVDDDNQLWVGTIRGLNQYNREQDHFVRVTIDDDLDEQSAIDAINSYNGKIFLGTEKSLLQLDPGTKKITGTWVIKNIEGKPLGITSISHHNEILFLGTGEGLYCIANGKVQKVNAIGNFNILSLESSSNNLFVGTAKNGLHQMDLGKSWTKSPASKKISRLTDFRINTIREVSNGTVWIGTDNGIYLIKLDSEIQHYGYDFDNMLGISDPVIEHIYEDYDGSLWISTALSGILHYSELDNQFRYVGKRTSESGPSELLDYNVLSMYADQAKNKLWIGSRRGLSVYRELEDRFFHYPFTVENRRSDNQILSITSIDNSLFYLGTDKGLFLWDDKKKEYSSTKLEKLVNKVFIGSNNTLWIGTENHGLSSVVLDEYGKITGEITIGAYDYNGIPIKHITDIIEFPKGKLWVGTSRGLFKIQDEKIENFELDLAGRVISDISVNFIHKSKTNSLILGTKQEGAIEIMSDEQTFVRLSTASGLISNDIRLHIRGPSNSEWVATNAGLVSLYIQDEVPFIKNSYYVADGLQSNQFYPDAAASMQRVYLGGPSGLTIFDPSKMKTFTLDMKLTIQGFMLDGVELTPQNRPDILQKTISTTESITLPSGTKNFTIEFQGHDYLRPDSIVYSVQLSPYDSDWIVQGNKNFITYNSLPRGKVYTFRVKAKSRYREWSDIQQLEVYIEPFFYDTNVFKACAIMALVLLLIVIERYRSRSSRMREQRLAELVETKTHELSEEVEKKRKTLVALEKAKTDAEEATKAKSQFLAKMSHEMRTPLNGIMGITDILYEDGPSPSQKNLLSILKRSSTSLKGLVDDLLDLGRIEADKLEIQDDLINVSELMTQVYEEVSIHGKQNDLAVTLSVDENIPRLVRGDAMRLKQVLLNLSSNALKFTESGSIELKAHVISISKKNVEIQFEIDDTGIGIDEKDLNSIFSSFVQAEKYNQKKYDGTGLGLGISKQLIKLMGGHIWAESQLGEGSSFKIIIKFEFAEPTSLTAPISSSEIPDPGRSLNILLVEDNDVNILVATKLLQRLGHQVGIAKNGEIALDLIEKDHYDLILMDVQMPVMNGYEATIAIRKSDSKNKDIPIIALSAGAMIYEREKCMEVGMNGFLSKPIVASDLKESISKYFETQPVN